MKVLHKDEREGSVKLLVETIDDLWHLNNIIRPGDRVSAVTFRRDEKKSDKIRSEKIEKKRMYLALEVKDLEFVDFSDRLRVHGVIREGPQDIGAHHTFNFEVGSDLKVTKELWGVAEQKMLNDAVESTKRPLVTLIAIEEGEASIAIMRQYGVKEVASISFHTQGKQYKAKFDRKEFFKEVLDTLAQAYDGSIPLVIVGPGFTKEDLSAYGREQNPGLFKDYHLVATGQAGMVGVYEAIKSGKTVKVLEGTRVSQETQMVERLFEEISKSGLCDYGEEAVGQKVAMGAVETLMVTDTAMKEKRFEGIMLAARDTGTETHIISTAHEAGRRLRNIGGIAAILRYKV